MYVEVEALMGNIKKLLYYLCQLPKDIFNFLQLTLFVKILFAFDDIFW